jgi:hypothetical protein
LIGEARLPEDKRDGKMIEKKPVVGGPENGTRRPAELKTHADEVMKG